MLGPGVYNLKRNWSSLHFEGLSLILGVFLCIFRPYSIPETKKLTCMAYRPTEKHIKFPPPFYSRKFGSATCMMWPPEKCLDPQCRGYVCSSWIGVCMADFLLHHAPHFIIDRFQICCSTNPWCKRFQATFDGCVGASGSEDYLHSTMLLPNGDSASAMGLRASIRKDILSNLL